MWTFEAFTQSAQAISVTAAACVTLLTVNAWRAEMHGRRKLEVAEALLTSWYEAVDRIAAARNGFSYENEGKTRTPRANEAEDTQKTRASYFAPAERLLKDPEFWSNWQVVIYKARFYFGNEVNDAYMVLMKVRQEIMHASSMLAFEYQELDRDLTTKLLKTIWSPYDDENRIETRLSEAQESIERVVRPSIGLYAKRWRPMLSLLNIK